MSNNTLPNRSVRIGYHRLSDDSVSSGYWEPSELRNTFIAEVLASPDIDRAWWRVGAHEVHYIKGQQEERTMFNVHNNYTADGVLVTVGLVVYNNNLDVVTVTGERASSCCEHPDHVGQMYQSQDPRGWFTDHDAASCDAGGHCRHNHWFETTGGSFDGERLSTTFQGKKASL